jgi:hypothetical protein
MSPGRSIRECGVQFDLAVAVERGTETGVEPGVVLQSDHDGFDGGECVPRRNAARGAPRQVKRGL